MAAVVPETDRTITSGNDDDDSTLKVYSPAGRVAFPQCVSPVSVNVPIRPDPRLWAVQGNDVNTREANNSALI
jgi:hypothetical protein